MLGRAIPRVEKPGYEPIGPGVAPPITADGLRPQAGHGHPDERGLDEPPPRVTWLVACAGLGGWSLVVLLGRLNPFEGDLFYRWMILGGAGWRPVLSGAPLSRRLPVSRAQRLGAGCWPIVINLLAAGGIGVPTVALGFGRCWRLV